MNKTHDFKLNMPDYSDVVDIDILNDNFRVIDDALMAGLCEKEYTGNNMGSSDPATRKYAWAPWFEIKNENDFDVQVTDRNFETTITIEAGGTYRKYIVGTYYMNFYVQDQHDVTFRWFCDAETRIKEIDPSGGGSVSSVNVTGASSSHIVTSGGPITSSGTIEIDLAEGYSIPQTNKQTSWDGKAADLKAEIDSSTYVLTLQLKDSAGNLIGTAKTIDLPLETMVVDGEYDPQTQKIKLELKNGNYVEFSVADLVSGLQTELNSNNKLNPEYIAYDTSHRAVSDTEKDTWNGKQNAISDLATIRSGATAGATAVQPSTMEDALDDKQDSIDGSHKLSSDLVDDTNKTNKFVTSTEKNTWNSKQNALTFDNSPTSGSSNPVKSGGVYTALSGKQDTIDSSHKLSSALVSFSTAQNAALSSGIDSTKVGQISTNQTNILYTAETGVVNLCPVTKGTSDSGGTVIYKEPCKLSAGTYDLSFSCTATSIVGAFVVRDSSDTELLRISLNTGITSYSGSFTLESEGANITLYLGTGVMASNIMIKPSWITGSQFRPYALPNYDLTRLEAEDRAGLIDVVDSGAKNLLDATVGSSSTSYGVTFTNNNNGTWTVNGTCTGSTTASATVNASFTVKESGTYVISGCPSGGSDTKYELEIQTSSVLARDYGTGVAVALTAGTTYQIKILVRPSTTVSNLVFKPMCCTKAAFGVSQKFVPYRMSYQDLCDKKDAALSTTSKTSGSLDDIAENSFYFVSDGTTGRPVSEYGFVKTSVYSSSVMLQEFTSFSGNAANSGLVFVRVKQAGTWQSWKQLTNA